MSNIKVNAIVTVCGEPKEVMQGARASFRVVQNVWAKDATEPTPTFFTVVTSSELKNLGMKLKPGSKILINGDLVNPHIYEGQNGPVIDFSVFANHIEFAYGSKTIQAINNSVGENEKFIDRDSHRLNISGFGRLTKDLEIKTKDQKEFAIFTIAFNGYNDSVVFLECITSRKLDPEKNKKGNMMYVEGTLRPMEMYDKKDGSKGLSVKASIRNIEFMYAPAKEGTASATPSVSTPPAASTPKTSSTPASTYEEEYFDMPLDDDLPF